VDTSVSVYAITLPEGVKEDDFNTFMLEEVFPAISKKSTRAGQVTGLYLLQGNTVGHTHEYLWLVYGVIAGGPARQAVKKLEAFGAQVAAVRDFSEVGHWLADEGE
jgi:hypothetical protein